MRKFDRQQTPKIICSHISNKVIKLAVKSKSGIFEDLFEADLMDGIFLRCGHAGKLPWMRLYIAFFFGWKEQKRMIRLPDGIVWYQFSDLLFLNWGIPFLFPKSSNLKLLRLYVICFEMPWARFMDF